MVVAQIRWIAWSTFIPHSRTVWSLLLLSHYADQLVTVDAVGSVELITDRVLDALGSR